MVAWSLGKNGCRRLNESFVRLRRINDLISEAHAITPPVQIFLTLLNWLVPLDLKTPTAQRPVLTHMPLKCEQRTYKNHHFSSVLNKYSPAKISATVAFSTIITKNIPYLAFYSRKAYFTMSNNKFIQSFTKIPKELFRLNTGPAIRLRAQPGPVRPQRSLSSISMVVQGNTKAPGTMALVLGSNRPIPLLQALWAAIYFKADRSIGIQFVAVFPTSPPGYLSLHNMLICLRSAVARVFRCSWQAETTEQLPFIPPAWPDHCRHARRGTGCKRPLPLVISLPSWPAKNPCSAAVGY
jgi:hypothetical protein